MLMLVRNWCVVAARLSTPPIVDAVGVGNRAEPSVPLLMLAALVVSVVADATKPLMSAAAGCAATGTPLVLMLVKNWCVVAARLSTPPIVDAVGVGKRPEANVPLLMLPALVVSVVADATKPLMSAAAG